LETLKTKFDFQEFDFQLSENLPPELETSNQNFFFNPTEKLQRKFQTSIVANFIRLTTA